MYPAIEPYHSTYLQVSDRHRLYYEEVGNPEGMPVLVVHGGPGAGCNATQRCFFDPKRYRVILVDQRGCGRSQPLLERQDNHTEALAHDFEVLREALSIEAWLLFGGSWGSLLSLVYAIKHPDRVLGLVLRGVFLGRPHEWQWLLSPSGSARLFPHAWTRFVESVGQERIHQGVEGLYAALGTDQEETVARAFAQYELSLSGLHVTEAEAQTKSEASFALSMGVMAIHYAKHQCFLSSNYLLEHVQVLGDVPATIVQGRYDVVTPAQSAWQLHQVLPKSILYMEHGGHASSEEAIAKRLRSVMDGWPSQ